MHPWHPDAVALAAKAKCDPRTAVRYLKGEHIRTHRVRKRLEKAVRELELRAVDLTEEDIDDRLSKAETLARLHGGPS